MLMFGKMSVGVRAIASGPTIRMSSASTTNVYGRRSAIRTIHIGQSIILTSRRETGCNLLSPCAALAEATQTSRRPWGPAQRTRGLHCAAMPSFLSRLPLFAGLSPADCAQLEPRMRRRDFAPQAVIVREGTAADAAFFILSGRVAVRRKDPETRRRVPARRARPGSDVRRDGAAHEEAAHRVGRRARADDVRRARRALTSRR